MRSTTSALYSKRQILRQLYISHTYTEADGYRLYLKYVDEEVLMNSRRVHVARCVAKYALASHSASRWNIAMKMLKASLIGLQMGPRR
ncbi:hypothetical protein GBS0709_14290 [Edwardsiella tarda]|nr:hypothetical protein GBS0709_14290 [Edwardsiella tarda]